MALADIEILYIIATDHDSVADGAAFADYSIYVLFVGRKTAAHGAATTGGTFNTMTPGALLDRSLRSGSEL